MNVDKNSTTQQIIAKGDEQVRSLAAERKHRGTDLHLEGDSRVHREIGDLMFILGQRLVSHRKTQENYRKSIEELEPYCKRLEDLLGSLQTEFSLAIRCNH